MVGTENVLIAAGTLNLRESILLIQNCRFVVSNDTGAVHMASSVGVPVVSLYTIRDIPGSWFPLHKQSEVIAHQDLECDYRQENCIQKSIEKITVDEVMRSCDKVINETE